LKGLDWIRSQRVHKGSCWKWKRRRNC